MMRDTPRSFVGTVTFHVDALTDPAAEQRLRDQIARVPGLRLTAVADDGCTVTVTASAPVDRAEVVTALERAGCRILS